MVPNTKNTTSIESVMPIYRIWHIISLCQTCLVTALLYWVFFKMAMTAILHLEVKMVPNTKNIPSIKFVMPKYRILHIIYLHTMFSYRVIVFFHRSYHDDSAAMHFATQVIHWGLGDGSRSQPEATAPTWPIPILDFIIMCVLVVTSSGHHWIRPGDVHRGWSSRMLSC